MPECTSCRTVKPLDDFSEAQLCGKRKCLQCSNPRLYARRLAARLDHQPLSNLGRSRPSIQPTEPEGTRKCTGCGKQVHLAKYSRRQLSGKGKCPRCATLSTAANLEHQAKRKREDSPEPSQNASVSNSEDEAYEQELLRSVDEARKCAHGTHVPHGLDEQNAGHRILRRLGWEPGSALGSQQREQAPLPSPPSQSDRRGLGQKLAHELSSEDPGDVGAPCIQRSGRAASEVVWEPFKEANPHSSG